MAVNILGKRMRTLVIGVAMLAGCSLPSSGQESDPGLPGTPFPARVLDISGKTIDVARLAQQNHVVVVTLKATWCQVCQEQLRRIRTQLPAAGKECGITYLVLAPGPRGELASIQKGTQFPYPFIEDRGLKIAKSLGLAIEDEQILPAILILASDRTVAWMQRGRNGVHFGDPELLEQLGCLDWI